MKERDLQEKIDAISDLHKKINLIVPLVQLELSKGFKQSKDFSLFKKDKEKIKTIINKVINYDAFNQSCIIKADEYSISLTFKTFYGFYYFKTIYVFDITNNKNYEFKPLQENFYIADIVVENHKISELNNQIKKLVNKKSDIIYGNYSPFIEKYCGGF